nr:homocysteine S-methyltransferase family protein [Pseudaminobacter sp.]
GMPYTYTVSFDTAGRSMMGLAPKDIHGLAAGLPESPVAVGANCGVGASDILASLLDMTAARPEATVIVKGNCGIPEFRGTEIHYSGTPELMADYVRLAVDSGAKIIGGCCGTSFEHLAAMRHALDAHRKESRPTVEEIAERIGPLRNKTADKSGGTGETGDARRERRRGRG